ncbi:MAG: DNA-binding transcriptional regulator, AcrR family [Chloroflexi bacterium]|jgi:AcrR family transcriptional regulator|nr:MAG: DNA-binding transcriptional regulator, AcrR family [Chloroflexota bacterium]
MPRKYDLGKRRSAVEETVGRIVDATLHLHSTKGPAFTSVRDIAQEADVSLITVYRHFTNLQGLFRACGARYFEVYTFPSFDDLKEMESLEERVATLLDRLYLYYDAHGDKLWPVYRDSELILELKELFLEWDNEFAALARSALSAPSLHDPGSKKALATLLVLMSVTSWRNLVRIQGLPSEEAAALASKLVTCSLRS